MNTKSPFGHNRKFKELSKNKNFQSYAYLVFSFLAIVAFGFFAIWPTIKDIQALQKNIEIKKQTFKKLQAKSASLTEAMNNFNAIDDSTKLKLYTLLPDSTNLPCFLDATNTLATSVKVAIQGIQAQQIDLRGVSHCTPTTADLETIKKSTGSQTTLSEIHYSLNNTGNYQDLLKMIDDFNNANRLNSIESVVFNKSSDSPLVMSVSGKIFFYK